MLQASCLAAIQYMSSNLSHNDSTVAGMTSGTGCGFIVAECENRGERVEYCDLGKLESQTIREVWRKKLIVEVGSLGARKTHQEAAGGLVQRPSPHRPALNDDVRYAG